LKKNISNFEKNLLTNYICLFSSIFTFIIIAVLVSKNITNNLDYFVLLSFRNPVNKYLPIGPSWLLDFFKDATSLGGLTIVALISVITVGILIITHRRFVLRVFLISVILGGVSDLILKEIFSRQRPSVVLHLVQVNTFGFPSGHATMSVVIYFSIVLIVIYSGVNKKLKTYLLWTAVFLVLIIGISRIYLGVHYPTDILAGWSLGMFWISIEWILIKTKSKLNFEF